MSAGGQFLVDGFQERDDALVLFFSERERFGPIDLGCFPFGELFYVSALRGNAVGGQA